MRTPSLSFEFNTDGSIDLLNFLGFQRVFAKP